MASTVAACWLNSLAVCNVANKPGKPRELRAPRAGLRSEAVMSSVVADILLVVRSSSWWW